jgi:RHS repeat-associated protein
MVEAKTVNTSNLTTFVTDEFFSYSPRGELAGVYEATPHSGSGVYYSTGATYWPSGTLKSLSGIPSVPTIYYGANGSGLDGEGRYTQITAASGTNPVSSVTYSPSSTTNPLGALTGVTFGSTDSDTFTYDSNTGRMLTYTFSVNSQTDAGTMTWNPNGTLETLAIVDHIPGTSDTQTCNYEYDDVQRVSSSLCGSIWGQTFTYDSFGNITKSGTSAFTPTYSSTTNQFTISGVTVKYDADGNLLTDNLNNTYTWDPNWGNMLTVTDGSTTVTATYDALGRMVENNAGGTYSEFVYGPTGVKLAKVNGTALIRAFVALPGGAKAIYGSSGTVAYYRHSDWLGSSRLSSTQSQGLYSSTSYAPFGEQYATASTADASFTGQDQDTVSTLYDFLARRQSPSQGRWISPDPAGRSAVIFANPQSWNRYSYVMNNPLALTDPAGLSVRHHHHPHTMDDGDDGDDDTCDMPGEDTCGDDGDDGSDDSTDNSGDGACDATCQILQQINQAAQEDVYALGDSGCAQTVDGGSPAAASTLASPNGDNPLQTTITTGDQPPTTQGGSTFVTGATTEGTPVNFPETNIPMYYGPPVTITVNTNSSSLFLHAMPGYSIQLTQAIDLMHEVAHAAVDNGLSSVVVDDSTQATGGSQQASADLSQQNNAAIASACYPQGDFGGNQGPSTSDPPQTDVPAIKSPVKHF